MLPKLTALWESIDNWAIPTRSPSPEPPRDGPVEEVTQHRFESLADLFNYSNFDLLEDPGGYQNITLGPGFDGVNNPYTGVEAGWF